MCQIGNIAGPPGEVIVFQGWQGLYGEAKGRNRDCRSWREGMSRYTA